MARTAAMRHLARGTKPEAIETWEEMLDWVASCGQRFRVRKNGRIRGVEDGACPGCAVANVLKETPYLAMVYQAFDFVGVVVDAEVMERLIWAADRPFSFYRADLLAACGLRERRQ